MQFTFDAPFELVSELPYLCAAPGGRGTAHEQLPLLRAPVSGLPPGLHGLLITSDLQGIAPLPSRLGETSLLGEALIEHLETLVEAEVIPDLRDLGALIAGDMFSGPRARKRGATGDVIPVWTAFAQAFHWVAGVAGNHDLFPQGKAQRLLERRTHARRLDGGVWEIAGLRVGGVSGIIGGTRKPNRHSPERFAELLTRVLRQDPDIVVLHAGPPGETASQRGDERVAETLAKRPPPLVVCGHCHWDEPLAEVCGTTVLNVDARAVLLCPATDAAGGDLADAPAT